MKNLRLFILLSLPILSCEDREAEVSGKLSFWLGNPLCVECSENSLLLADAANIQFYDSSSGILYLRKPLAIPLDSASYYSFRHFSFIADDILALKGVFQPAWSSSLPSEPSILVPPFLKPDDLIPLSFQSLMPKEDPKLFILALKTGAKLHNGLQLEVPDVEMTGQKLTFMLRITNHDQEPLLVLDPHRCGTDAFFWYTPEPSLFNGEFLLREQPASHDPGFSNQWLTLLKPGESIERQICLDGYLLPRTGEYRCTFSFSTPCLPADRRMTTIPGEHIHRIWCGTISHTINQTLP